MDCKVEAPAVFLDRDGVINLDYGHVGHPHALHYVDGALDAIKLLNSRGFRVFIVTNQSGIGKGLYTEADFHACMTKIQSDLSKISARYDDFRFCPYHPEAVIDEFRIADHVNRKPNPGMLLDLMRVWKTDRARSFIVGDKKTDIVAGRQAGIRGYIFDERENLYEFIRMLLAVKHQSTR